ncbi:MAG: hypothetical protein WA960_00355 [Tunicatimonas sp.]
MKIMMPLFSLASLLLFSCENQIDENELIGNWEVSEFKANTPELSQALIEGAKIEALSTSYLFKKDKTCSMKSNYILNGRIGKYELIAETSIIKITYPPEDGSSIEEYKVESLNGSSMKWTQNMGELGSLTLMLTKE